MRVTRITASRGPTVSTERRGNQAAAGRRGSRALPPQGHFGTRRQHVYHRRARPHSGRRRRPGTAMRALAFTEQQARNIAASVHAASRRGRGAVAAETGERGSMSSAHSTRRLACGVLALALAVGVAGCKSLRSQLSAAGSTDGSTPTTDGSASKPKFFDVRKGPTPDLLRLGTVHTGGDAGAGRTTELWTPRLHWDQHASDPSWEAGAAEEAPSPRHQRVARSRSHQ